MSDLVVIYTALVRTCRGLAKEQLAKLKPYHLRVFLGAVDNWPLEVSPSAIAELAFRLEVVQPLLRELGMLHPSIFANHFSEHELKRGSTVAPNEELEIHHAMNGPEARNATTPVAEAIQELLRELDRNPPVKQATTGDEPE